MVQEQQERPSEDSPVRPPLLTALLQAVGFIDLALTEAGVLVALALRLSRGQPLDAGFVAILVAVLVGGVTLGGLLIGLAATLRYGHTMAHRLEEQAQLRGSPLNLGGGAGPRSLAEDPAGDALSSDIAQILALLTDIRDLQSLAPEEREAAQERLHNRARRRAAEEVIDAINNRQLGKARLLLEEAETAYGSGPTLERLRSKIEEAAERNEALDYARTKRLVDDAVNAGQWAVAENHAHTLYSDHPQSGRSRRLWENTRRARLYAHIQASAEKHHWAEAVAAAEEFLERFPGSREAEALRGQMGTLRTNAEIVERKQYEARFKEFIAAQQYADALRIARHVVEQFPDSPQAQALRDQIPRLEKRVTSEPAGT